MSLKIKRAIYVAFCVAVLVIVGVLFLDVSQETKDDLALRDISVKPDNAAGINGDGYIHLSVGGTNIDYIVAQADEDTRNDYYLSHDPLGNENSIGCPFVDYRSSVDATNTLIYAHGASGTDILFSELKEAYKSEVFEGLQEACITLADGTQQVYEPLCAMSVDMDYQTIQQFDMSLGKLTAWLKELKRDASVVAGNFDSKALTAKRVLTLVTCSSQFSGQRERTLVVFGSQK